MSFIPSVNTFINTSPQKLFIAKIAYIVSFLTKKSVRSQIACDETMITLSATNNSFVITHCFCAGEP